MDVEQIDKLWLGEHYNNKKLIILKNMMENFMLMNSNGSL